jgi:hypothetical protein
VLRLPAVQLHEQPGQLVQPDRPRDQRSRLDRAVGERAHRADEVGVRVGQAADDRQLAALPVAVRHLRGRHRVAEQGERPAAADQLGAGLEQRGGAGALVEDVRPQPVGQLKDAGRETLSGSVDVGEAEAAGGLAPRLHGFDDDDGSGAGVAGVLGGEQADGSGALDHDDRAEALACAADGVEGDGGGFDEAELFVGEAVEGALDAAFVDGDVLGEGSVGGGVGRDAVGLGEGGVAVVGVSGAARAPCAAGRADAGDDAVPHGDGRDPAAGGDDGAGPLVAEHRGRDEPAGRPPVRVRRAHARVPDAHDDLLLPRSLEVDLGEGDRALGVDGGETGAGRQVGHADQGRRGRQVLLSLGSNQSLCSRGPHSLLRDTSSASGCAAFAGRSGRVAWTICAIMSPMMRSPQKTDPSGSTAWTPAMRARTEQFRTTAHCNS